MEKKTTGTVLSVKKQWWLKINTKPFRTHALDGAIFPHIVKVKYTVDGVDYVQNKWLRASITPPRENEQVSVIYRAEDPKKSRLGVFGKLL